MLIQRKRENFIAENCFGCAILGEMFKQTALQQNLNVLPFGCVYSGEKEIECFTFSVVVLVRNELV